MPARQGPLLLCITELEVTSTVTPWPLALIDKYPVEYMQIHVDLKVLVLPTASQETN